MRWAELLCRRYKIAGWSSNYTVTFERLPNQINFDTVLARPWVDEVEDYTMYRRLHSMEHAKQKWPRKREYLERQNPQPKSPEPVPAIDGMTETIPEIHVQPASPESPLSDSDPSTAVPVRHLPGMQPGWWADTLRITTFNVPEHQETSSAEETAMQNERADADQR